MSFDKLFDGSDAHLLPENAAECLALLRQFNEWRRFDGEIDEEGPAMPHPKSIGFALDMAIRLIEERGELLAALEAFTRARLTLPRGEGAWSIGGLYEAEKLALTAIAIAKGGA